MGRLLFSELNSNFYLAVSQGIGSNRIEPPEERERKSISKETTFSDTSDRQELLKILANLCKDLASDCSKKEILGHSITVKIKSHDFKTKTKVAQLRYYSNDEKVIHGTAKRILLNMIESGEDQHLALRLIGIKLSNLQVKESDHQKPIQRNNLRVQQNQSPELKPQNTSKKSITSKRREEVNFSCISWLHCNLCQVEKSVSFFMTSCAKVLCQNCKNNIFSNCNFCGGQCRKVELNKNAPKEVINLFSDLSEKIKEIYKIYHFQMAQQKMLFDHKIQRNARNLEQLEAYEEENNALRNRLNQLKKTENKIDKRIEFLEAEIEQYKHFLGNDGNDSLDSFDL